MAELLAVPRRAPLLQVRRRVFDSVGTPVELSHDSYRADISKVTVSNRVALAPAGVSLSFVQQAVEHGRGVA
jgi:hypothetical protein